MPTRFAAGLSAATLFGIAMSIAHRVGNCSFARNISAAFRSFALVGVSVRADGSMGFDSSGVANAFYLSRLILRFFACAKDFEGSANILTGDIRKTAAQEGRSVSFRRRTN